MPGMSGVQFSNALRIFYANKAPPLVLITASQLEDVEIGPFERVLQKPVSPQEMLDMVRELVPD
jgi:CheY-like chemotaxis protein